MANNLKAKGGVENALNNLEIKFQSQLTSCLGQLEQAGYKEENIVALDFLDGEMTFLMTDGEQITINPRFIWFVT